MTTNTDLSKAATNTVTILDRPAALYTLRARYGESRDLFSPREMAHLRFLRWLIQSGRLTP